MEEPQQSAQEPTQKKPGQVIAACPKCSKKIREGDKVITAALQLMRDNKPTQMAVPAVVCLKCGIVYVADKLISQIKKQNEGSIITPQKGLTL